MPFNLIAVLVSSLVTLLVGFVWYNPKVFGTIWMQETGMTEEKAQKSNMLKVFGLTIFLFHFICFGDACINNPPNGPFGNDWRSRKN